MIDRGWLLARAPWVPVWVAAWAVAAVFTVVARLGTGFPPWMAAVLWAIAIAMTLGLLAVPPHLVSGWRPGERGDDEGQEDDTRPIPPVPGPVDWYEQL